MNCSGLFIGLAVAGLIVVSAAAVRVSDGVVPSGAPVLEEALDIEELSRFTPA